MERREEKTAVITGASSGIGREFVRQLKDNPEIDVFWVIARRKEKLEELQALTEKPVVVIPLDLCSEAAVSSYESRLQKAYPRVTYLINCAGMGKIGSTQDISLSDTERMIDLNCKALASITKVTIPYMPSESHIIQAASIAGFQPMPYFSIYAATKAFVLSYTKALHYELQPKRIKTTALCPYWIKDTEFISIASDKADRYGSTLLASKAEDVVHTALRDNEKNRMVSAPGPVSSIDRYLSRIVSDKLTMRILDHFSKL